MRIVKIIEIVYMALYIIISSQLLYYLFIMSDAFKQVSIETFIQMRQSIDPIFKSRMTAVYYAALVLSSVLLILKRSEAFSVSYFTLGIACICLLGDLLLAVKGNIPINHQLAEYVAGSTKYEWLGLRNDWIKIINYRGYFNAIGIFSLILGLNIKK